MEYAESPSTLWNICQQSLLRHGELHNNLRMTWGKAVPLWTESLEHSLFIGQTLNDKYALDGRDPSSVVGIQWCHGLFDRPFFPSMPVMGVVRKRDILTHASRLDVDSYEHHVNRSPGHGERTYHVVGTDIVASSVARMLHDNGLDVCIVENKISKQPTLHLAVEDIEFPSWMEERVASMCEQNDINTVNDVAVELRKDLSVVEKVPKDSLQVHESKGELVGAESLSTFIQQSMWESVAHLWQINASTKRKNASVQTKLI